MIQLLGAFIRAIASPITTVVMGGWPGNPTA